MAQNAEKINWHKKIKKKIGTKPGAGKTQKMCEKNAGGKPVQKIELIIVNVHQAYGGS